MPYDVDPIDSEFPALSAIPMPGYAVALHDYFGLSLVERAAAETRYCKALERRLGSAQIVTQTLRAVASLSEEDLRPRAGTLAMRWRQANSAARTVGLQGLVDKPEAWFNVRIT